MSFNVFGELHSLLWVLLEESFHEVNKFGVALVPEDWLFVQDIIEHLTSVVRVEGGSLINHLIDTAAKRPPVEGSSMAKAFEHLRGGIF